MESLECTFEDKSLQMGLSKYMKEKLNVEKRPDLYTKYIRMMNDEYIKHRQSPLRTKLSCCPFT